MAENQLRAGHDETANKKHPRNREKSEGGSRIIIMLLMTFLFFVVEIGFGYLSNSMALVADSFHMLSDVLALAIAYGCLKMSVKSSKKNTFGWVRAEVLGALVNGVFLLALCFSIFIESMTRLIEPDYIRNPAQVLVVGVIGLIINLIGMFMFHSHGHGHNHGNRDAVASAEPKRLAHATIGDLESKHLMSSHQDCAMALAQLNEEVTIDMGESEIMPTGDIDPDEATAKKSKPKHAKAAQLNMRGIFLHVLSDALGSVIVIISSLVSWLVPGHDALKLYLDPGLSLAMVFLLVASTLPLVRETALILMQTTPGFVKVEKIRDSLLKVNGVQAVHEFHVWRLVGERIIATVHIRFSDLKAYLAAADEIRTLFHDNSIHSTTIQPEFSEMDTLGSGGSTCALACPPDNCWRTDVTCCKRSSSESPTSASERETTAQSSSGRLLHSASAATTSE
ncbi:unnamed protein product [Enterobius vermicularis]|uniref:Cation efflux protein n=1 Tax=Enterobius vermicularis TaxID=51028 RepID=A0A0N4VD10_ENTVE|nr:unnamed protein product [Enterobius vermicularis]